MTGRTVCLLSLLLLGMPLGSAATGAKPPMSEVPEFVGLRVGFGNSFKVGQWVPVSVTLRGGTRRLVGIVTLSVEDGDGVPTSVGDVATPANTCQVLPGKDTTVRMYVKFGQIAGDLTATLHEPVLSEGRTVAGKVITRKRFHSELVADEDCFACPLAATQELIVTVGAASVGIESALGQDALSNLGMQGMGDEAVSVRLDNVDDLPTRWYGYESVDVLVLATSLPGIYRKLTPNSARIEALDTWVRNGGKLVLLVGRQADQILADGAPLARFAPGKMKEMVTLRSTAALEAYAGSDKPVPGMTGRSRAELLVPRLTGVRGTIEATEAGVPIIVRSSYGLGLVIFVAADLEQLPWKSWGGRGRLFNILLDRTSAAADEGSESGPMMHVGYNDLGGQLRSELDHFTGVKMVPFWIVAGLILLYILLIGPGDYFFLRKVVGRMQWTWVTFPTIVIVVSVGAYGLAYWLKGNQLRVNQVDLVDVDVDDHRARGTTWANFFSPRTDTFNLSFRAVLPDGSRAGDAETITSWFGLPGEGLGGMGARTANPQVWNHAYRFSPKLDAMVGVPVQVWSTRSVMTRWQAPCDVYPEADLVEEDELPRGAITNTLDVPLEQCILAYGRWGYDLGTLRPGQSAQIDPMSRKRIELKTLLARRFGNLDVPEGPFATRLSEGSRVAIANTLQRMMFFEALGGKRQQGLSHRYQRFVDFSDLLRTGRAVLVAIVPAHPVDGPRHGAVLLRDGQPMAKPDDRHLLIYRFVYPVPKKKEDGGQ